MSVYNITASIDRIDTIEFQMEKIETLLSNNVFGYLGRLLLSFLQKTDIDSPDPHQKAQGE